MLEVILMCALCLPVTNFNHGIVSYHAIRNEEDLLRDNLRKHPEIEDVFITPAGQKDKLKEYGWSELPFSINKKEIWIKRKEKNDKATQTSA